MFVEELFGHAQSPILMYGEDHGDSMIYSPAQTPEENEAVKANALKNLERLDIPFEVAEMQGFKIAMAQHEYAAEKILDKHYLRKLAAGLGSNSIVVGIPMKGFMVATAKGQGEAKLYGAVVNQYKNAQTYPISDALYYIVDGEIEMMGGNQSGAQKDENGILEITASNDARGKLGFVINVGHKSEDELANQIQTAFQNVLMHGMKDAKNFNGKIDFRIHPTYNPLTPGLEERLRKMAQNISERGAVQLMGGLSGEEFKVRFFYGNEKLIAETIETDPVQLKQAAKTTNPSPDVAEPQPKKKPWWKF
jgi:hypothetical protein